MITPQISLREADERHANALFVLGRRILEETPYFLREPAERARNTDDMRAIIRHYTATPGWCMIHAWADGTPVAEGVLSGTGLRRTGHIGSVGIGVLRAHWGSGIGAALMAALEDRAQDMGLERLSFTVFAENQRARDFYKRLGYREEGVFRASVRWPSDDPQEPLRYSDEIAMAKWIGGSMPGNGITEAEA